MDRRLEQQDQGAQAALLWNHRSDQPLPPSMAGLERTQGFRFLTTQDIGGFHSVIVATHKKIDLVFSTQVHKPKRGPLKRSLNSASSFTFHQNAVMEDNDETPAHSPATLRSRSATDRAPDAGAQDYSRTPGGAKCK